MSWFVRLHSTWFIVSATLRYRDSAWSTLESLDHGTRRSCGMLSRLYDLSLYAYYAITGKVYSSAFCSATNLTHSSVLFTDNVSYWICYLDQVSRAEVTLTSDSSSLRQLRLFVETISEPYYIVWFSWSSPEMLRSVGGHFRGYVLHRRVMGGSRGARIVAHKSMHCVDCRSDLSGYLAACVPNDWCDPTFSQVVPACWRCRAGHAKGLRWVVLQ